MHVVRDESNKINGIFRWPQRDGQGNLITEELTQAKIDKEAMGSDTMDANLKNLL